MRAHLKFSLLTVMLIGIFCIAVLPTIVNAASAFCNTVDGQSNGPAAGVTYISATPLAIGDILTITYTGTATQGTVEIPTGVTIANLAPGNSVTYTVATAGITQFRIINLTGLGDISVTVACRDASSNSANGEAPFTPNDGRINHHTADRAAPVALYCQYGGIQAIRIDPVTGSGAEAVRVGAEELVIVGVPPEGNIILAQTGWVILSRLADGRFQANAWYADGKPYTMTWVDCNDSDNVYLER